MRQLVTTAILFLIFDCHVSFENPNPKMEESALETQVWKG